jgi:uncharacterized lipoprotein YmbA
MKYLWSLVLFAMLLASCNATKDIKLYNLEVGMSKSEAKQAIRKKPDNSICAKQYIDGQVEVVQYSRYELDAHFNRRLQERYWVYFFNDKLVGWQRAGDDCIEEADRVYERSLTNQLSSEMGGVKGQ